MPAHPQAAACRRPGSGRSRSSSATRAMTARPMRRTTAADQAPEDHLLRSGIPPAPAPPPGRSPRHCRRPARCRSSAPGPGRAGRRVRKGSGARGVLVWLGREGWKGSGLAQRFAQHHRGGLRHIQGPQPRQQGDHQPGIGRVMHLLGHPGAFAAHQQRVGGRRRRNRDRRCRPGWSAESAAGRAAGRPRTGPRTHGGGYRRFSGNPSPPGLKLRSDSRKPQGSMISIPTPRQAPSRIRRPHFAEYRADTVPGACNLPFGRLVCPKSRAEKAFSASSCRKTLENRLSILPRETNKPLAGARAGASPRQYPYRACLWQEFSSPFQFFRQRFQG